MDTKQRDFQKRLLATFKIEAQEHVHAISSGLVELEKAPAAEQQAAIIETIFREAHSLKGAARAVTRTEIEAVCQSLESVFAAWQRQKIVSSSGLFNVLHHSVDTLSELLSSLEVEPAEGQRPRVTELTQDLERVLKGEWPPVKQEKLPKKEADHPVVPKSEVSPTVLPDRVVLAETVRVSAAKLDSVLLQAEELFSAKLTASQRTTELREMHATLAAWKKEWARLRLDVRTVQRLLDQDGTQNGHGTAHPQIKRLLEFLDWNQDFLQSLEAKLTATAKSAEHDQRSLGGIVDHLLEDVKKVLMLPFSSLLEIFPRFVRDLSRDQGKDVELVIHGGDIDIDRRVLEEMKDPLVHLMRNCIDHGIEKPEEREHKKKPPRGTVTIAISQKDGNHVELLIADDGRGIDIAKVKATAAKLGMLAQEAAEDLSEQEALSLIFQSGVSTSPILTDISGRGLGLPIVREKVEKLSGAVSVETHPDSGTTLRIILPLTLATFRGVIVRVDEHLFVLPTVHVERVVKVNTADIKTVENRETIPFNGQVVSFVRLADALELPRQRATTDAATSVPVVVLVSAERRMAFLVDEVLKEQEVLVKTLGKPLSRVRNIAGVTVLGTGRVVPILNVLDVMHSAVRMSEAGVKPLAAPVEEKAMDKKTVLVVEDSITSRTLIKNILDAAGYEVETAVDGLDGFTKLRSGEFDLVVSDVDMPRMNGFDLTAKIRGDTKLAEVPLVLVTALESREHRERGIEVGANAYIVKSSFDQSNLLDVIRRLI